MQHLSIFIAIVGLAACAAESPGTGVEPGVSDTGAPADSGSETSGSAGEDADSGGDGADSTDTGQADGTTFDEICRRDASGFPADPDVVNCWGFESEEELFYHDPTLGMSCVDPRTGEPLFADHVNGNLNPAPIQNAGPDTTTCLYPQRDSQYATSGSHSLRIVQVDEGGANSGGHFFPYMKQYVDETGTRRFAAFGAGGEFWIHWRYRQDEGLFNYHSKRFMVTHEASSFEHVLIATGEGSGVGAPPYRNLCAYNNKGTHGYGCSDTHFYEADRWHRFVMHVKLSDNEDMTNGIFELFMDGDLVLSSYEFPMRGLGFSQPYADDLDWNELRGMNALFRLDFLLFENGKMGSGPRPMGSMWIDDVVVSRKELPLLWE